MMKCTQRFDIRQIGRSHNSTTAATGIAVYTQKAGLILVATPPKISQTGCHLCRVACGGVPPNGPGRFGLDRLYINCCSPWNYRHLAAVLLTGSVSYR